MFRNASLLWAMLWGIGVYLVVRPRTWYYIQSLLDCFRMWAYMGPAEIEGTLPQAREELNQEVAGLLCQERVDPGDEESRSLQWPPPLTPHTPFGHLMGMDDPVSNRTGVKGWKRKRIPPKENLRLQCHLVTVGVHVPEGLQVPLQDTSVPFTVRTRTKKSRQADGM